MFRVFYSILTLFLFTYCSVGQAFSQRSQSTDSDSTELADDLPGLSRIHRSKMFEATTGYYMMAGSAQSFIFNPIGNGLEVAFGYRFSPHVYAGALFGLESFGVNMYPMLAQLKFNLNVKRVSPTLFLSAGYSRELDNQATDPWWGFNRTPYQGFNAYNGIGVDFQISKYLCVNMSAGHRYLNLSSEESGFGSTTITRAKLHRLVYRFGLTF